MVAPMFKFITGYCIVELCVLQSPGREIFQTYASCANIHYKAPELHIILDVA